MSTTSIGSILSAVNTVNLVNTVNAVRKVAAARRRGNLQRPPTADAWGLDGNDLIDGIDGIDLRTSLTRLTPLARYVNNVNWVHLVHRQHSQSCQQRQCRPITCHWPAAVWPHEASKNNFFRCRKDKSLLNLNLCFYACIQKMPPQDHE
jgi:hypothetical protein